MRIFQSIEEIGKDSIDSITDDPFFTYAWFKTIETHPFSNACPLYLTVYYRNNLEAFAPIFIESSGLDTIFSLFPEWLSRMGFKILGLHCQSIGSARSKVLVGKNFDRKLVLGLMAKRIDDICRKQKILFSCFPYVSQLDEFLMGNLQSLGYAKRPGLMTFYLDVEWTSFQDYLKSLKSKVRKNVKREIKRCNEQGIFIEEPQNEDLATKLSELYSNLSSKYEVENNVFDLHFFKKLNEHAKDKTKLFVARKNNEVVGFSLCLWQGDVLDVMMVGFNYDVQTKTDFTYFNLGYYAPIKWAIGKGIKRIYYRNKAEKVKINRGCKPDRTCYLEKCHSKLLRVMISRILYPIYDHWASQKLLEYLRRQ